MMQTIRPERVYAGYLAAQAVVGVVWWVVLSTSSSVRSWFELLPDERAVTDAWVFADLGVVVLGSALAAWGLWSAKRWAVPVVAFTAGGIVYPTLFLVGWVAFTDRAAGTLLVMMGVSTLTCWIAYQVWRTDQRTGRP